MAENRETARIKAWQDALPAFILLRAVRLAFNFRSLLLSTVAIVCVSLGWWLLGWAFSNSDDPALKSQITVYQTWPWTNPRDVFPTDRWEAAAPVESLPVARVAPPLEGRDWLFDNPLVKAWRRVQDPFWQLFQPRASWVHFTYLLLCGLWALAVWAFFGGAVTRLAAVAISREEQSSWTHLLGYARSKWTAYFSAPLFPLLGALLVTVFLCLFGLLLRFDVGVLIAGLLWFVVILGGFVMAMLLVGLLFGWPLMWATISAEGTDSFDALSRTYAYTYQRPLSYFFYFVVAAILGTLGWIVVSIFATAIIQLGQWAVSWGSGNTHLELAWPYILANETTLSGPAQTGSALIAFWVNCVWTVAVAFLFSYLWTSTTAIYFLLRRRVDATEMDEVFLAEEEEAYGLPPLKTDAAGVPEVADDPAVAGHDTSRAG